MLVEISITESFFVARISLDAGDGHARGPRIVRAESCDELLESVAIVVAMALPELDTAPEPTDVAEPEPESAEGPIPVPTTTDARNETSTAISDPEPVLVRRSSTETDVFVAGAGAVSGQGLAGQLLVGARWRQPSRSIGVELRADTPESRELGTMRRIDIFRFQVTASPCVHAGALGACGLISVGSIYGSGIGLQNARSAFTPLVSGGVRLTWRQAMTGRIAVQLHMDLAALFTHTEFHVDQMPVWNSGRFEGSLGAGIVARFL